MTRAAKTAFLFALLAMLAFACCSFAVAQDEGQPAAGNDPLIDNHIYKQLPPEDQEKLIEEATHLYNYCEERTTFAHLHDCRCVAAKAMEVRLNDPESKKTIIAVGDEVADQCPNGPGAAGYAYNQCVSLYTNIMAYGLDTFCTCYANAFGRRFIEAPGSYLPYLRKIGVAALAECRDQDIPNPFRDKL